VWGVCAFVVWGLEWGSVEHFCQDVQFSFLIYVYYKAGPWQGNMAADDAGSIGVGGDCCFLNASLITWQACYQFFFFSMTFSAVQCISVI
jgi:hypothetical protein